MVTRLQEKAYAKVNLHLEVSAKRPDGYHDIVSLMAAVDLYDLLTITDIELTDGDSSVVIENSGGLNSRLLDDIPPEKNLVTRAVHSYFANTGKGCRLQLQLEKNIPAGAGLGGGSSDAAAILRVLNRKFSFYTSDELYSIGSRVGADVPFCIQGGISLCEGIGEIITPLDIAYPLFLVIVNCGVHVNTAQAYSMIDNKVESSGRWNKAASSQELKAVAAEGLRAFSGGFFNDFELPVFDLYPELLQVKNFIKENGAPYTVMTGSGSTIIAVFDSLDLAEKMKQKLLGRYSLVISAKLAGNRIY